jgi:hypothetical protein
MSSYFLANSVHVSAGVAFGTPGYLVDEEKSSRCTTSEDLQVPNVFHMLLLHYMIPDHWTCMGKIVQLWNKKPCSDDRLAVAEEKIHNGPPIAL